MIKLSTTCVIIGTLSALTAGAAFGLGLRAYDEGSPMLLVDSIVVMVMLVCVRLNYNNYKIVKAREQASVWDRRAPPAP